LQVPHRGRVRDAGRGLRCSDPFSESELVPSEASGHAAAARPSAESVSGHGKHPVSGGMLDRVVDLLEIDFPDQ
jgi:hypothetical protein